MTLPAFRAGRTGIWLVIHNGRRGWAPTFSAAVRLTERPVGSVIEVIAEEVIQ